ncbi:MAG: ABC transporter permease [Oscillospiraceae bacterium]|nr:ABC transporter permease [Oscillospiraceae bacterium]
MNRMLFFAARNGKEMVRDKLNLFFGIGFPIILLVLLSAIQANIPAQIFAIEDLAPGVAVFGLSFISLFAGFLIAKDRSSAFVLRLYTSPLTAGGFIGGYTLPLLPMALVQIAVCFLCAFLLGLPVTAGVLLTLAVLLPAAVLFIALGLLCGTLLTDKQVGGVCGALLTNLCAWLSGTWFDVSLVGGWFEAAANALPFIHAVKAGRAALRGNYGEIMPHLWWVIGYAAVLLVLAVWVFTRKRKQK